MGAMGSSDTPLFLRGSRNRRNVVWPNYVP